MKEIILANGEKVLVDDEDYPFLNSFAWKKHRQGYATTEFLMHRFLMHPMPVGFEIHYINGNKLGFGPRDACLLIIEGQIYKGYGLWNTEDCRKRSMTMTKPMAKKALDNLNWKPLTEKIPHNGILPYVTHEGILKVGDFEFHVLQLNTGARIFIEEEVMAFFGLMIKGK